MLVTKMPQKETHEQKAPDMTRLVRKAAMAAPPDMLDDVEIPLKNLEFTIEQYLMAHGPRLDTETRVLLAGVRDCVGRVAESARVLADEPGHRRGEDLAPPRAISMVG